MLRYVLYASALLYVTNAILERHHNGPEEAMFADVIKNISRVNNVLQELISNYGQLQKLYKSQEKLEDDYSSDTEIDEVFKSMKKDKRDFKKNSKGASSTDKPTNVDSFPATQMIWSEDDDNDDYISQKKPREREKAPKTQRLQKEEINDDVNSSSESMELYNITTPKPKGAKIIFIDTHKQIEAMNESKKQTADKSEDAKPKTRYHKVKNEKTKEKHKYSKVGNIDLTLRKGNDSKIIKKVVHSEKFPPKSIWDEIIKNKPIQLEPQKGSNHYGILQNKASNKAKPVLRSEERKTALVIVTNNKQKKMNVETIDTFESAEDDTIAKEIFKTKVLRHAYGDACLKVVMKKCYKACKQAGKSFCQTYKCKSAFRSKFKQLSKSSCLREFKRKKSKGNKTKSFRGHDEPDEFIDATRGGLLDAACFEHLETEPTQKPIILRNDTAPFKVNPITKYDKAVNILRDKYERACKRESAKKCLAACKSASMSTCSTFNCSSAKKKRFKKYCKARCKTAYKVTSTSDSDSDSDSSAYDSDSDESESDSDDTS